MNLTKILKEGDSIYSPMLGFVIVETISPSGITVLLDNALYTFYPDGRYVKSGEVMLKANKQDDFHDYPFKRGDYLVTKQGDTFIASGENRIYVGAAVAIHDCNLHKEIEEWAAVERYATDHEQYLFDQELAKLGYKWDGKKLVSIEEWINIYKSKNGTISSSYQSYSSKELAYIARAKDDYYATIRIK